MDVIFLDFAKAFDKVPKERLLQKLKAHGVHGNILRWIRNWLTGRRQRVVLNGKCSDWADVLSGVPQGSVLGPILFLIFINDLDAASSVIQVMKKFADDTKLGHTVSSEAERGELQGALDNLGNWAELWGMEFNVKKCKVMHVGFNNQRYTYTMSGEQLEVTEEERDIGVNMTSSLKPSQQCKKAARTAQTVLSQLARAFHFRDRHVFLRLYIQYVRPHLEYAVSAWAPWYETDKECLEKVQRRAVNMISGLKATNYAEKLKELGITSLEERRRYLDMLQTYKVMTGKDNVERSTWFDMASSGQRATRQAADPLNIRPKAARLEVRRHFFSQRVVERWNEIPEKVKSAESVIGFKSGLKKHLQSMQDPEQ